MKIAAEREDLEDLSGFQNVAVHDASELYISIGQGNRKIGLIPSWSLPQVETCNPRCLPHCGKDRLQQPDKGAVPEHLGDVEPQPVDDAEPPDARGAPNPEVPR